MSATSESLRRDAQLIVDAALQAYGAPCAEAYADLLRAYIAAPPGGRDALFLEVAYRAVGISQTSRTPCSGSPATSAAARPPASDQAVADLARSLLAAIRSQVGS